jgi:hypothetical protein
MPYNNPHRRKNKAFFTVLLVSCILSHEHDSYLKFKMLYF